MKRPILKDNATEAEVRLHAERMDDYADAQCGDISHRGWGVGVLAILFLLAAFFGIYKIAYPNNGKEIQEAKSTKEAVQKELATAEQAKAGLERQLTEANIAKKDAEKSAGEKEQALINVRPRADQLDGANAAKAKAEGEAEKAKEKLTETEKSLATVRTEMQIAKDKIAEADKVKVDLEKKLTDAIKAPPAPAPAPIVAAPPLAIDAQVSIAGATPSLPAADDLGTPVLIRSGSPAPKGEKHYEGERVEVTLADGRKGFRIYHKVKPPVRR